MANPVGALSHAPQVAQTHEAPAAKPAANQTKVTPQETVNISAAGKAASQAKPGSQVADEGRHGGEKSKHFYLPSESTGRDWGLRHHDPGAPIAVPFFGEKQIAGFSAKSR